MRLSRSTSTFFFFFNDTATTEIYTLSLHDALPIPARSRPGWPRRSTSCWPPSPSDRKSTRLNSSHVSISYAVFCLKKKKGFDCRAARVLNDAEYRQRCHRLGDG